MSNNQQKSKITLSGSLLGDRCQARGIAGQAVHAIQGGHVHGARRRLRLANGLVPGMRQARGAECHSALQQIVPADC